MIGVCSIKTLSLAAVDNFMIFCVMNIGLGSIGFGTILIFDFYVKKIFMVIRIRALLQIYIFEDRSNTNMGCDNFSLTPSESIYVYHNSVFAVNNIETTTK